MKSSSLFFLSLCRFVLVFGLLHQRSHAAVHIRLPITELNGAQIVQRDGHAVVQVGASTLTEYLIGYLFAEIELDLH